MSDFDLLVRGSEQDIGISEGKIVAVAENLTGSAKSEIDAHNLAIFPGVIDAHVHFNEPGRTDWEGFATGSRAAAAGGTTTVFDMPLNAHPPTTNRENFELKRAAAEASSLVDFGLWGGLVPGNLSDLEALRDSSLRKPGGDCEINLGPRRVIADRAAQPGGPLHRTILFGS